MVVQEAFTGDQFGQAVDLLQGQVQDPQRPASHLNYVVMNDQMQVLSEQSGALQIKGAGVWAEVSKEGDIVIEQPGLPDGIYQQLGSGCDALGRDPAHGIPWKLSGREFLLSVRTHVKYQLCQPE